MVSLSLLKAYGTNCGMVWQTLSLEKLAGTYLRKESRCGNMQKVFFLKFVCYYKAFIEHVDIGGHFEFYDWDFFIAFNSCYKAQSLISWSHGIFFIFFNICNKAVSLISCSHQAMFYTHK